MFLKHLSSKPFNKLKRLGTLNLYHVGATAVLGREYFIENPNYGENETIYAKCISENPIVLELIEKPSNPEIETLTKDEARLLAKMSGEIYAEVIDGVTTNVVNGEVIPTKHLFNRRQIKNGIHRLSEYTCGGALPNGKGSDLKETPENLEKYQCRVGRHAPKCTMYSKDKCAKYSSEPAEMYTLTFSPTDLIALIKA